MPTMEEYLREMELRAARGWTPGVPSRFTTPVATSWNLPTTARTTMRQALPRFNLGDIAAASADPTPTPRRGRPRTTPAELQSISDRANTGTLGKTVKAIAPFAKLAGPLGLASFAYDALRPSQLAMADEPTDVPGYSLADPTVTWSPDQGAAINEAKIQALAGTQTGYPPAYDASANVINPLNDIQPITDFIAEVPSIDAGMTTVPSAGSDFFGGGVDAPFDFADDPVEEGEVHDVHRHMGLTMGIWPEEGDPTNLKHQISNIGTQFPSWGRKIIRDRLDTIEQFLDDETTTDKLQDLINNQIAEDTDISFTNQGLTQLEKYHQAVDNPNVVYDQDSLNAMVALAKDDYYKSEEQVQEAINEIKSGVDTFKDVPTESAGLPDAPAVVRTETISKRELQRQHQERKDALAAQRKADLARQKAAADAQKEFNRLAAKATQEAAAARKSAAAQADKAKSDLRNFLSSRAYQEEGEPVPAHLIDLATQVDTFAGYGGPMSAAEINVAGGMEFGGAGGMAGSGRGSSGRGGPGGRGR